MNFLLELVTGPEIEPVTLAELKASIRTFASSTDEDDLLTALIQSAREWVEGETGRVLVDQTWKLTVDTDRVVQTDARDGQIYYSTPIPTKVGEILLQKSPALAILSFISVDATTGVETAVTAGTYELREADSKWPRIVALDGSTWSSGTFRITFRAGYSDQTGSPQDDRSVIPNRFKQAMMLYAEAIYDRDPALIDVAKTLIKNERCNLQFA